MIGLLENAGSKRRSASSAMRSPDLGGTMRLGAQTCELKRSSLAHRAYGPRGDPRFSGHRHRYEFNNNYRRAWRQGDRVSPGVSEDGLVRDIELRDHPWLLASRSIRIHVEPRDGHPLSRAFIRAARAGQGLKLAPGKRLNLARTIADQRRRRLENIDSRANRPSKRSRARGAAPRSGPRPSGAGDRYPRGRRTQGRRPERYLGRACAGGGARESAKFATPC